MAFIASRAFGFFIIIAAIGVVVVLWVQCGRNNGCTFSAPVQASPVPTVTPESGFGTMDIHVDGLIQGAQVTSPLTITGKAIPDWYIGGAFTVRLLDAAGHGLAYTQAHPTATTAANGFIPFSAQMAFFPTTPNGMLIIEKNLGSGLPDFPSTIALPVTFPNYINVTPTPIPSDTPTPIPSVSVTPATTGVLKGVMTIGPLCGSGQTGASCSPSVKMFADRPITVSSSDHSQLIATIIPSPDGTFAQELPAGKYYIFMLPQILGSISGVPTTVTITSGKTTTLNISVDTGIGEGQQVDTSTSQDGF